MLPCAMSQRVAKSLYDMLGHNMARIMKGLVLNFLYSDLFSAFVKTMQIM